MVRFLIVLFFIMGAVSAFYLNEKEDPEFNFRTMVVSVYWPSATTEQVELHILQRLEQHLNELAHVNSLYGYALPGEAQFYIELDEGLTRQEIDDSWYQVRKKVFDIRHILPDDIVGPFFNDEFGDVFGSIYALVGDGYSYAELKLIADDIRRELMKLPDVGKVLVIGDQPQKIYIEFSHAKMATLGVDPKIIIDTIQNENKLRPAGIIRTKDNEIILRISGVFDSIDSIQNTNIHTANGNFRLSDIAEVYRGYEDPPKFKIHYNGKEAIDLIVSMKKGRDVLDLGQTLTKKMNQIKESLPLGIEIHQVSNQPQVVKHAIHGFLRSLVEAIIIVMIISFFSLGFRAGMVVALSIPLVLAITFSIMYLLNIDLQRVSLGALIISIGLLVDDAMIADEMMMRKLEEGFSATEAATFAYTSTAFPMLTGTLLTIAGFFPIGLANSDTGEYTRSILSVISISLLASWFVAVFFTPYIGYILLKGKKTSDTHKKTDIHHVIRRWVRVCVDNNKLVLIITLIAFFLAVFGFNYVHKQFFPPSERNELLVNLQLPEGTPYSATEREVNKLEGIVSSDKNIINYTTYIGGYSPRFYLPLVIEQNQANFAQMVIMTKGGAAREKVFKKVGQILEEQFPLVLPQVSYLENGPPVGYPIQFRISGKNHQVLLDIASEVEKVVKKNPYTTSVNNDWGKAYNEMLLVDNDKAHALGVSGQDIATNLDIILNGYSITKFREGTELIDIEARGKPSERFNLDILKDTNIYSQTGQYIPLDNLVKINNSIEEHRIWRRDGALTVTVRANVVNANSLDVSNSLFKQLTPIIKNLPNGYEIKQDGVAKSSATALDAILAVVPFTLFIMLVILMLQLGSFQRVLLVFLTAPLGLIGVTLSLLIFQKPFGFVAIGGFIALMGMIMRNSVILIDQIEKNIKANIPPYDAIIKATVDRFRPIMLTAFAAIFAMIPLLTNIFWGAMATTIMGGLLVATILTIIVLPAKYAWWFKIKKTIKT